MAVVLLVSITAAVTVIVTVFLVIRNRRGDYSTGTQKRYVNLLYMWVELILHLMRLWLLAFAV